MAEDDQEKIDLAEMQAALARTKECEELVRASGNSEGADVLQAVTEFGQKIIDEEVEKRAKGKHCLPRATFVDHEPATRRYSVRSGRCG